MKLILLFSSLMFLPACAPNVSPDSYSVGSVGAVNRTVSCVVISARTVQIKGTTGVGGTTGAATEAVAGSTLGGGTRSNIAGAIGGVVVGGIAGAMVEEGLMKQSGKEYVIQTDNGNLMTIVQGREPEFLVGDKVFILYGNPSRIIKDQRI